MRGLPGHVLVAVVPWASGAPDGPPISNVTAFKLPALGAAPVFTASITPWLAAAGVADPKEAFVLLTATASVAPWAHGGSTAAAAAAQRAFPQLSGQALADIVAAGDTQVVHDPADTPLAQALIRSVSIQHHAERPNTPDRLQT